MNNIEKKFFETFEIEPVELEYPDNFECYSEITDRILLELFLLWHKCEGDEIFEQWNNKEEFKNWLLNECCYGFLKEDYLKEVQALFKEVE